MEIMLDEPKFLNSLNSNEKDIIKKSTRDFL